METEAYRNMFYSLKIVECKNELINNYSNYSTIQLKDASKLPLDIFYDLLDTDLNF